MGEERLVVWYVQLNREHCQRSAVVIECATDVGDGGDDGGERRKRGRGR